MTDRAIDPPQAGEAGLGDHHAADATAKPMANATSAQFGYVYGLDALRLVAVLIVIVRHYEIVPKLPGGFGVSIFFFISGFLISRLLLAEEKRYGRIRLGAFYTRRFIRLLPPLLLMGAVALPALYAIDPATWSNTQAWLSFTYLGNIAKIGVPLFGWHKGYDAIEPLWSLAVEEHFYLMVPAALIFLRSPRSRIALMTAAIVVPLLLRLDVFFVDPADADTINYNFTFTRIDSMAWGVLFTLLLDTGRIRLPQIDRRAHLLLWGGVVLMLASMAHYTELYEIAVKYTPQSFFIGIFFAGAIFASQYGWLRAIMERRPIVHLGRISYEMYLWHFPILTVVAVFIPGKAAVPLSLALTVVIADIAYRLTTKQLRKLRVRFGAHPVA